MKTAVSILGIIIATGLLYLFPPERITGKNYGNLRDLRIDGNFIHAVLADDTIVEWQAGDPAPRRSRSGIADLQSMRPLSYSVDARGFWLADPKRHVVRRVDREGRMQVHAGAIGECGRDDGSREEARFCHPVEVAADKHALYIADAGNHLIRRIDLDSGVVSTLAGSAETGFRDGQHATADFYLPGSLVLMDGTLFVLDRANHAVRRVDPATGKVATLAGNGRADFVDGRGRAASFRFPGAMLQRAGQLYVLDLGNFATRRIDPVSGAVKTVPLSAAGDLSSQPRFACLRRPQAWCHQTGPSM